MCAREEQEEEKEIGAEMRSSHADAIQVRTGRDRGARKETIEGEDLRFVAR